MILLVAVKGNREMKISPDEKDTFLEKGFDIYEVTDKKVVLIDKYSKDSKEVKALRAEVARLKIQIAEAEIVEEDVPEEPKKPNGKGK